MEEEKDANGIRPASSVILSGEEEVELGIDEEEVVEGEGKEQGAEGGDDDVEGLEGEDQKEEEDGNKRPPQIVEFGSRRHESSIFSDSSNTNASGGFHYDPVSVKEPQGLHTCKSLAYSYSIGGSKDKQFSSPPLFLAR